MDVFQRDASWFPTPGVAGKYHAPNGKGGSMCGVILLNETIAVPVGQVTQVLRCRRAACRIAMMEAASPKENP